MAAVTKNDIPEISNFMPDFWKLIKATWKIECRDEYWSEVLALATELNNKYNNHPFCKGQIMAYMDYLDKEGIKQNEQQTKSKT